MGRDPTETGIFPRPWVLGVWSRQEGLRRPGRPLPRQLPREVDRAGSPRRPPASRNWGRCLSFLSRGVEIPFNLCRQYDRYHSPSQPGASRNPRACQQEPATGGEASFISSAAVEQVRSLIARIWFFKIVACWHRKRGYPEGLFYLLNLESGLQSAFDQKAWPVSQNAKSIADFTFLLGISLG